MRNGRCCSLSSISTVSRYAISVGPWYQGVWSLGLVMLSPLRPDTGIATMSFSSMRSANAVYSATMRSKTSFE